MRRTGFLAAALLAACLALAPGLAMARAGSGGSFGSRGGFTYSAPPATRTSPYGAAPVQRSLTQPRAPYAPGVQAPGYRGRSPLMSGILGGLIGAGIGGLLFGGGLFHGVSGFGGLLGLLIQIVIVVFIVRFVWRLVTRRTAMGGGGGMFGGGPGLGMPMAGAGMGGGFGAPTTPAVQPVTIGPADYQAFEQLLQAVQAAWSAQNIHALQAVATPEMVSYFSEQLADQSSRGTRNVISDVHLDQGDLSESWAEQGRDYATVAMKFSMLDVTMDAAGRVVDGDPRLRTQATEIWTFLRAPGGRWVLSAIQQAR